MRHVFLVGLIAIGCSGNPEGGSTTDSGSDAWSIDAAAEAPPSAPACPESPPPAGTRCAEHDQGALCTYGDEVAPWCRTQVTCRGSTIFTWQTYKMDCASIECPSAAPATGSPCTGSPDCAWSDGTMCTCNAKPGGNVWRCEPGPSDVRCPRVAPNLGAPCTTSGLTCDYVIVPNCLDCRGLGYTATCKSGVWQEFGPDDLEP